MNKQTQYFDDYINKNKKRLLRIQEIAKLRNDFEQFVNVFYKLNIDSIGNTTLFLDIDYVVYKLCVKNGIPVDATYKSSNNLIKMIYNERACKDVFQKLGWKFIPWNIHNF